MTEPMNELYQEPQSFEIVPEDQDDFDFQYDTNTPDEENDDLQGHAEGGVEV